MPEIITTPNALVQTTNGKRFYVYSGAVSVPNSETTMISIDNIGERDIKIKLDVGNVTISGNDLTLKVKVNGIIIYQSESNNQYTNELTGYNAREFIIPANTSFDVTLESETSTYTFFVAGYGKYI